jgi:hypothetical protein
MKRVVSIALVSLIIGSGSSAIAEMTIPVRVIDTPEPISGQTCTPLSVVGIPGQTSIRKSVSQVGLPWLRANWNTDFAVNNRASRYVATVQARSQGDYRIAVYLKYPNQPADKVFEQDVPLESNDLLVITGAPRRDQTPSEVNIFVGGLLAAGNGYVASASACDQPQPEEGNPATENPSITAPTTTYPSTPSPSTPSTMYPSTPATTYPPARKP